MNSPAALRTILLLCLAPPAFFWNASCNRFATNSLDQAAARTAEPEAVSGIQTPQGFRAVRVAAGINYPSAMTWDAAGRLYVLESHTVPIPLLKPKILRVEGETLVDVAFDGPDAPSGEQAIGLEFHGGWLYFSHEEKDGTWGISRVKPEGGKVEAVLRGMPGDGDHAINYLAFDKPGNLYFGLGSATNSGVISSHDPVNAKWLKKRPAVRDIPCRELHLKGTTFTDKNELTEDPEDQMVTGAFAAYGNPSPAVIPGEIPCSGAVFRLRQGPQGIEAKPELLAWGFRNPVALAFDRQGKLLIGMQGADIRGTRPVQDDPDAIYRLHEGGWYGWPDYSAALLPMTDPRYRAPAQYFAEGQDRLEPLIDLAASQLKAPDRSWLVTTTDPHAAICGMTVVPSGRGPLARWAGRLLVSEMGDFRPTTDPEHPDVRAGFQVEAVDLATGKREVFVRNRGKNPGQPAQPASALDLENGLERPVDVKVGPDGAVYVLDFGVFEATAKAAKILPKTGKVFKIVPAAR
jgi:glucose/arabinose dehydrogenase